MSKYDTIGIGYNTTRQADPYLTDRIFWLLSPAEGGSYLDIGCGTGNYTLALTGRGLKFTGIDPSDMMLDEAKLRSAYVVWLSGSAENIPAENISFDGVIAILTIHHWENIEAGFKELFRVIKPDSRVVILTSTPKQMSQYWLNEYFPDALDKSIHKMPSLQHVKELLHQAKFSNITTEKYFVKHDLADLFLHSGKNRPEIYFDENIQKGISTFASLATKEEMERGLLKLRHDLDDGSFEKIKNAYDNDLGDYLFIVATKEAER